MITHLAGVCDLLRCPRCGQPLTLADRQLGCPTGHRFDVARQGYVNLLPHRPPANADTAEMVRARFDFLAAGHYRPLVEALAVLPAAGAAVIIDVGAGPGRYLAEVLDRVPAARGLALDVSVPACRRAARAHPRMGAVVSDVWQHLPVADDVADVILVIFAPRNFAEFDRVLRPGGRLIIVTPQADHLHELVSAFGLMEVQPDKADRLHRQAEERFEVVGRRPVRFPLRLGGPEIVQLIGMGPNAFHIEAGSLPDRAAALAPLTVTASCLVTELISRPR